MAQFSQPQPSTQPSAAQPSAAQPEGGPSTRGSHSPPDPRDLHDGMSRLYVDPDRAVGWGKLYPERATLHTVAIAPEDVVQVIVVDEGARDVALPFPDKGEGKTMYEAATTQCYLLWPHRLIDIRVCFCFTFICINLYFLLTNYVND